MFHGKFDQAPSGGGFRLYKQSHFLLGMGLFLSNRSTQAAKLRKGFPALLQKEGPDIIEQVTLGSRAVYMEYMQVESKFRVRILFKIFWEGVANHSNTAKW